jgi:hypothetical protein
MIEIEARRLSGMIGMRVIVSDNPHASITSIVVGSLPLLGSDEISIGPRLTTAVRQFRHIAILPLVLGSVKLVENVDPVIICSE